MSRYNPPWESEYPESFERLRYEELKYVDTEPALKAREVLTQILHEAADAEDVGDKEAEMDEYLKTKKKEQRCR